MGQTDSKEVPPQVAKPVRWWRKGRVWRRIGSDVTALIVGVIAALISWSHIVHVALFYGKQTQVILGLQVANLYPVSVDGVMIVGVIKAADDRASGRDVRRWARFATWFGGIFSVAAQVTSAWPNGPVAWVIAAVPSGALIVVIEVLTKQGKIANGTRKVRWWHGRKTRAAIAAEASAVATGQDFVPSPSPDPSGPGDAQLNAETPAVLAEPVATPVAPEPVVKAAAPIVPEPVTEVSAPLVVESEPVPTREPRYNGNGRPTGGRRKPPRATEGARTQPTRAAREAAKAKVADNGVVAEPVASLETAVVMFDDGSRAVGPVDDVIVAEIVSGSDGVR